MSSLAPPDDVQAKLRGLGVTSEAMDRLLEYVAILDRWRSRINLIGPASIDEIWRRHVLDCAQLWPHLRDADGPLLDLGAGAGLPGLILSALGYSDVTLVDSDQRKAVFLREAARTLGVNPTVIAARFDVALADRAGAFHVVTARAVAPLSRLAPILAEALDNQGYALLHKGAQAPNELTEAAKNWTMRSESVPSIVGRDGVILKIWEIRPNASA